MEHRKRTKRRLDEGNSRVLSKLSPSGSYDVQEEGGKPRREGEKGEGKNEERGRVRKEETGKRERGTEKE